LARVWVVRALVVLAATCLVAAFALLLMLPLMLPLAQCIDRFDHGKLLALQALVRDHVSEWAWQAITLPLLARPSWLVPLSLGIVLGGAAVTISWPPATTSHRRRG
jgi:hypothetical protein